MRVADRVLALFAALTILAGAGSAGAAWNYRENGPHSRIVKKQRSAADSRAKSSIGSGPTYGPACKRRPSTVKPFRRYCVADSASR